MMNYFDEFHRRTAAHIEREGRSIVGVLAAEEDDGIYLHHRQPPQGSARATGHHSKPATHLDPNRLPLADVFGFSYSYSLAEAIVVRVG